jgi:hypothetical protein
MRKEVKAGDNKAGNGISRKLSYNVRFYARCPYRIEYYPELIRH